MFCVGNELTKGKFTTFKKKLVLRFECGLFVLTKFGYNVFVVFEVIAKVFACAGSPPAELGVGPERG